MEDVETVLPFVTMDTTIFPVNLTEVQELQEHDRSLRKQSWNNPKDLSKQEIEQIKIITYKNRIYLPIKLCKRVLDLYHHYLCHPGKTRMHKSLASTMYWEGMEKDINTYVKNVPSVKNIKRKTKGTGNYRQKTVP